MCVIIADETGFEIMRFWDLSNKISLVQILPLHGMGVVVDNGELLIHNKTLKPPYLELFKFLS